MGSKTDIKEFSITITGCDNQGNSAYRYRLMRIWNEKEKPLMIIGCNPSIASVFTTDPTMDKVSNIAMANGYGGVIMSNLFAYRDTSQEEMKKVGRAGILYVIGNGPDGKIKENKKGYCVYHKNSSHVELPMLLKPYISLLFHCILLQNRH